MKQRQKNKIYDTSYKRLDKEKESGSDSAEETELFVRNKPHKIDIPTVEKVVEEGDTLQALAIQYHCSIADLKRINLIQNDNEIFAKRYIKVPHRPFTMALAGIHVNGGSSQDLTEPSTSKLIDIDSVNTKLEKEVFNVPNGKENVVNEIIFNSQITHIPNERLTEEVANESCDERVNLLPHNGRLLPKTDVVISRLSCNGADGDIPWKILLVCIIIFIFAIPLIYILIHWNEYHHHNS
ncbi:hypothetical protein JTB14_005718 [Gonioctena quinquepunctata]|nr:hypothetical protein JTB14_005718 [Gonioctena quinquepunctata]